MDKHDSSFDDRPYSLPPDLQAMAKEAEEELRHSIDFVEGGFLVRRQIPVLRFDSDRGNVVVNSSDLVDFLNPLVRSKVFDSATGATRPKPPHVFPFASVAGKKILDFLELNFYELRDAVCGQANKKGITVSAGVTGAIAGLTHWLFQRHGVQEEYLKSTATVILVALLKATKGAFCKMTEKQAKAVMARYR